jgi:hypothetical protein
VTKGGCDAEKEYAQDEKACDAPQEEKVKEGIIDYTGYTINRENIGA